jgi:protease-4
MRRVLLVLLILAVALAVAAGAAALLFFALKSGMKGSVPSKVVLEIDLEQPIEEWAPPDPFAEALQRRQMTVRDVVDSLERAAGDDRVVGLVARVGAAPMGMGRIQEVRDAVSRFRESGKPAVAYAETFGEFGPGMTGYYLATAFDTIYLQPSGDVYLTGLIYETPFLKGMFEKMGVEPRWDHRWEYKNAMNTFTEKKMTDPHREAIGKVMESQFGQMTRAIAEARKLDEERVRAMADRGPFYGREAEDAGLVDGLKYRDEVWDAVHERIGGDADPLYLSKYFERAGGSHEKGRTIALIYGVGGVQRGPSGADPLSGVSMGSDTVAAAFRAAVKDDAVEAIVFRVDSPGGSYVASDTIHREVARARAAGKPVIVSMGDVAGSGGYFVAMNADKIVAQPGTITGSIGVLAGKFLTKEMWGKIGLSWDDVHSSASSTLFTGLYDYSPEQWDRFEAALDRIYLDFTTKVAEGRNLPLESVQKIAKGRIWSGEDAKAIGLVDELGGFPEALALARGAAGIGADEAVKVRIFPAPKSFWEQVFSKGPDSSEDRADVVTARSPWESLRPLVGLARKLGLIEPRPQDVLMTPEFAPAN